MVLPRRNPSKKTDPFRWSTIMIGSLDLFSDLFSRTLKQCNQNCHSIQVAAGTFSQTMIQRKDRKDVMHLVSPFRSELGNEMQEIIVFLKLFFDGLSLKEVSVILKNVCVKPSFPCVMKILAETKIENVWKCRNSKLHGSTKSVKSIFSVCAEIYKR